MLLRTSFVNVHLRGALWAGPLPTVTPEIFTFGVGILDPMGSAGSCSCPCWIDVSFSDALSSSVVTKIQSAYRKMQNTIFPLCTLDCVLLLNHYGI